MPLQRVLEPEIMDTVEEAVDYDSMDHSAVNEQFVQDLIAFANENNTELTQALDLGTGTALIPIELCKSHSSVTVVAVDMAGEMLKLAERNVQAQSLTDRITLQQLDAKDLPFSEGQFACLISNSIIHHIPEPEACVAELARVVAAGGIVFVRDLMRPENDEQVKQIVQTYAGSENDHSKQMFDDSLRAALSLDEIRDLVSKHGFDRNTVTASSDRHWTWAAIRA